MQPHLIRCGRMYKKIRSWKCMRLCNLLWLNPLAWVEHLAIQLLRRTVRLLVTPVGPIYLGKSYVLPFLFLVLVKGMGRWGESRSSHRRCSKKIFLKNFTIFTRKHLCWSLFNKVAGFIKMRLQHRGFLVNIVKSLRVLILKNGCFCVQDFLG